MSNLDIKKGDRVTLISFKGKILRIELVASVNTEEGTVTTYNNHRSNPLIFDYMGEYINFRNIVCRRSDSEIRKYYKSFYFEPYEMRISTKKDIQICNIRNILS